MEYANPLLLRALKEVAGAPRGPGQASGGPISEPIALFEYPGAVLFEASGLD